MVVVVVSCPCKLRNRKENSRVLTEVFSPVTLLSDKLQPFVAHAISVLIRTDLADQCSGTLRYLVKVEHTRTIQLISYHLIEQ